MIWHLDAEWENRHTGPWEQTEAAYVWARRKGRTGEECSMEKSLDQRAEQCLVYDFSLKSSHSFLVYYCARMNSVFFICFPRWLQLRVKWMLPGPWKRHPWLLQSPLLLFSFVTCRPWPPLLQRRTLPLSSHCPSICCRALQASVTRLSGGEKGWGGVFFARMNVCSTDFPVLELLAVLPVKPSVLQIFCNVCECGQSKSLKTSQNKNKQIMLLITGTSMLFWRGQL